MYKTILNLLALSFLSAGFSCSSGTSEKNETNQKDSAVYIKPKPVIHHFVKYETGKVINHIPQANASVETFCLYLPKSYDSTKEWPVIYFFDAHARGKLPVNKYKELAEQYKVIFIASNNSQNGLPAGAYDEIVNVLLKTTQDQLNIDPGQVILAGFSGGAKVAANAAIQYGSIKGVIGCAAPFDLKNIGTGYFTYAGIVGKGDFNYWDMIALDEQVEKIPLKHQLFTFDGIHEWPVKSTFSDAVSFIINANSGTGYQNKPVVADPVLEEKEITAKNDYLKAFQNQSPAYWINEINRLQVSVNDDVKWSNRRLLSFINMMAYMRTSELLNNNHLDEAESFLRVFRASDPKNPDGPYLAADFYALKGDKQNAVASLNEALKLGYDDLAHFSTDPMLTSLKGDPGYARVNDLLNY